LKEIKKKCFIGRFISLKRESAINVFTVEEEEVLQCDKENKMTLRGKNFDLREEELNDCRRTEK
jgi:hypothetical protein